MSVTLTKAGQPGKLSPEYAASVADVLDEIEESTESGSFDDVIDARDNARDVIISLLKLLGYQATYTEGETS